MLDRPITVHSDENKPVRTHSVVTQARVQHYDDVVEYMLRAEVQRFAAEHKRQPTPAQIEFLRKELVRYCVIRRDLDTAQKLKINPSNILNETDNAKRSIHSRPQLDRPDI